MYPLIGSLAQIWQERNYLQLTDEEAETQLGPQVHKSQNLRAIKHQNCILDQELLNLSCCLFFTVHKLTIVFSFQSGYVSQYTASQSIKPKVVSIWLLTEKKKKLQSLLQTIAATTSENIRSRKALDYQSHTATPHAREESLHYKPQIYYVLF